MKKSNKPPKNVKSGTQLMAASLQEAAAAGTSAKKSSPTKAKAISKIPGSRTPNALSHSSRTLPKTQAHPAAITGLTGAKLAGGFSSYLKPKSKFIQSSVHGLTINTEPFDDSPKSMQGEVSPVDVEMDVLMCQIEDRDRELSRLRLENEVLRRRQLAKHGEPTPEEREQDNEKDELIKKLNKEITDINIEKGELEFKYNGLMKEHEGYESFVAEKIGSAGEELKAELKTKDERISELDREKGKLEQTIATLRHKLNSAEELKAVLEHERTELQKTRFMLDHEKSEVQKYKATVEHDKEELKKVTDQAKDLIKQCEDYENKRKDAQTAIQSKEEETTRLLEEKESMRQELDEWKDLAEQYKKQLEQVELQHPSLLVRPEAKEEIIKQANSPAIEILQTNLKQIKDQLATKDAALKVQL